MSWGTRSDKNWGERLAMDEAMRAIKKREAARRDRSVEALLLVALGVMSWALILVVWVVVTSLMRLRVLACTLWVLTMASCVFAGEWFEVTASAYAVGCTMPKGEEPNHSLTASGAELIPNWHIATDKHYPFGTVLQLSYDGIVTNRLVADRGRGIKGKNRIDLAMADCDRAKAWGVRKVWARVLSTPLGETN